MSIYAYKHSKNRPVTTHTQKGARFFGCVVMQGARTRKRPAPESKYEDHRELPDSKHDVPDAVPGDNARINKTLEQTVAFDKRAHEASFLRYSSMSESVEIPHALYPAMETLNHMRGSGALGHFVVSVDVRDPETCRHLIVLLSTLPKQVVDVDGDNPVTIRDAEQTITVGTEMHVPSLLPPLARYKGASVTDYDIHSENKNVTNFRELTVENPPIHGLRARMGIRSVIQYRDMSAVRRNAIGLLHIRRTTFALTCGIAKATVVVITSTGGHEDDPLSRTRFEVIASLSSHHRFGNSDSNITYAYWLAEALAMCASTVCSNADAVGGDPIPETHTKLLGYTAKPRYGLYGRLIIGEAAFLRFAPGACVELRTLRSGAWSPVSPSMAGDVEAITVTGTLIGSTFVIDDRCDDGKSVLHARLRDIITVFHAGSFSGLRLTVCLNHYTRHPHMDIGFSFPVLYSPVSSDDIREQSLDTFLHRYDGDMSRSGTVDVATMMGEFLNAWIPSVYLLVNAFFVLVPAPGGHTRSVCQLSAEICCTFDRDEIREGVDVLGHDAQEHRRVSVALVRVGAQDRAGFTSAALVELPPDIAHGPVRSLICTPAFDGEIPFLRFKRVAFGPADTCNTAVAKLALSYTSGVLHTPVPFVIGRLREQELNLCTVDGHAITMASIDHTKGARVLLSVQMDGRIGQQCLKRNEVGETDPFVVLIDNLLRQYLSRGGFRGKRLVSRFRPNVLEVF